MQHLRTFVKLTAQAVAITKSNASWEEKYHLIFSPNISGAIRETGISVDYYDPDTTYAADTIAYVKALKSKAEELQKILDALDAVEE